MFQLITCPTLMILKGRWEFTNGLITKCINAATWQQEKRKMRLTGVKRSGKASRFEGSTLDVMKDLLRLISMAFSMWKTGASQEVLVLKNPPANAGDERDASLLPQSKRFPGTGSGNPLQYSYLENPMDIGAWWDSQWGHRGGHNWATEHAKKKKANLLLSQYSFWKYHLVFSKDEDRKFIWGRWKTAWCQDKK